MTHAAWTAGPWTPALLRDARAVAPTRTASKPLGGGATGIFRQRQGAPEPPTGAEHSADRDGEDGKLDAHDLFCVAWQTAAAVLSCWAVHRILT